MMNLIESLWGTARTRLSNPLAGSFIFSWLVVNWKVVLVFLSESIPNDQKISLLIAADYFNYWNLLGLPLLFGIFLTLALPWATWWLEKVLNKIEEGRLRDRYSVTRERAKLEEVGSALELKAELDRVIAERDVATDRATGLEEELKQAYRQYEEVLARSQSQLEDDEQIVADETSSSFIHPSAPEIQSPEIWKNEVLFMILEHRRRGNSSEFDDYAKNLYEGVDKSSPEELVYLKEKMMRAANSASSDDARTYILELVVDLPTHPDETRNLAGEKSNIFR